MSCVTRCPRKNAPELIIMALRSLSIDLGYFIKSEKGRQQCLLVKDLLRQHPGLWLLRLSAPFRLRRTSRGRKGLGMGGEALGRCVRRLGGNLDGDGPGAMRRIPQETLTSSGGTSTRPGRPKGWRRCGRRVSERPPDGSHRGQVDGKNLHGQRSETLKSIALNDLRRQTENLVRLPERDTGRPLFLRPQLHQTKLFSGFGGDIPEDIETGTG